MRSGPTTDTAGGGALRLVAYVVAKAGSELDAAALRQHLVALLPDYMVPSAFVLLARLPLTPNGKLDRRALPAPVVTANAARRLPRTPQEDVLCELFAETLGVARGRHRRQLLRARRRQHHSIQLVSRARRGRAAITPRAVFEHQTVAELAAVAEAGRGRDRSGAGRLRSGAGAADADHALAAERGGPIRPLQPVDGAPVPADARPAST